MLANITILFRVSYTLFLFLVMQQKIWCLNISQKNYQESDKLLSKIQIRKTNLDNNKVKITSLKKMMRGSTKKEKIINILKTEYEIFRKDILSVIYCYEISDINNCIELSKKNLFLKRKLKIKDDFKYNIKSINKINKNLEKIKLEINKDFNDKLFDIIDLIKNVSLYKYLRILVSNKFIPIELKIEIMKKHSGIKLNDLYKLMQNGACLIGNNILIELKIGEIYGDIDEINKKITNYFTDNNIANLIDSNMYLSDIRGLIRDELISELIDNSAVINQVKRHFLIFSLIGSVTGFSPMPAGSLSIVNPVTDLNSIATMSTLSWNLVHNHYFMDDNNSMTNNLFINPAGYTYANIMSFNNEYGTSLWAGYTNNFLALGGNFTYNLAEGASWSNQEPTFLNFGLTFYGWRDQIGFGINAQTLLANSIGIGASFGISKSIFHDVRYLGQYPLDGRIAKLRGLHKIQIDHLSGLALKAGIAVNGSPENVPISAAFRAGLNQNTKQVFRTHVKDKKVNKLLKESDIPGAFYILGKKIKESKIPSFDNPENLQEGDELIEIKSGSLMGSFIVGLESYVPIHAFRIGANIEFIAEFELGLRKLPNNKYEISVEPIKILEGSLFESMLNLFSSGQISRVAVAKKQVFLFDFNNNLAKNAYYNLIHHGQLPTQEEISIYHSDKAAEYLLHEFRAHNKEISHTGVARTYLEHINIEAKKFFLGFQVAILSATINAASIINNRLFHNRIPLNLSFNGYDVELMSARTSGISTNGIIAVEKKSSALMSFSNQGFSGNVSKELFVIHERVYSTEEIKDNTVNKWDFDSLTIIAEFNDSIISGDAENRMVRKINKLFNANIDYFCNLNTKESRKIIIKKILTKEDLYLLAKSHHNIDIAHRTSKIDALELSRLINQLKYKHYDEQGLIVKGFVSSYGLKGFSAIHALLGSDLEKLYINSQSSYLEALLDAEAFVLNYIDSENIEKIVSFDDKNNKNNKKEINEFYKGLRMHLSNIDYKLRLLYDDKYFIDENSSINKVLSKEKIQLMIQKGLRQDKKLLAKSLINMHDFLLNMTNYEKQGFSQKQIIKILKMVDKKNLRLLERIVLIKNKYKLQIDAQDNTKEVQKRFKDVWDMLEKINNRIEQLTNDHIMLAMNKKYYLQYIEELTNAKNELSALINLQHLDTEDLAKLENKFSNPIKNFFKKSNRNSLRIEGYLRGAQYYDNNLQNIDKKSYFTKNSSVKNINHRLPRYKNNSLIHISNLNKEEYEYNRNEIVRNNDNNEIFSHNDYQ